MNDPKHDIEAMNRTLAGLTFVSSGPCPGCDECGLVDIDDMHTEEDDLAQEPCFSWSPCDLCHSSLGGDRHYAHARNVDDGLIHFDICTDCLMAIQ